MFSFYYYYYFIFFIIYCGWTISSKHHKAASGSTAQSSNYHLHGQKCYVEVTIGCPGVGNDKAVQSNSNLNRNVSKHHNVEQKPGLADNSPVLERTYIFPAEAVLVPVIHRAVARSSLKRHAFFSYWSAFVCNKNARIKKPAWSTGYSHAETATKATIVRPTFDQSNPPTRTWILPKCIIGLMPTKWRLKNRHTTSLPIRPNP